MVLHWRKKKKDNQFPVGYASNLCNSMLQTKPVIKSSGSVPQENVTMLKYSNTVKPQ